MKYFNLDTPSVIIDKDIMIDNIKFMQDYANKHKVSLRPHTKTHKTPAIALLQEQYGAKGITVAKTSEAKVMAQYGLKDIFIANEIVGKAKFDTIKELANTINISFGLDSIEQAKLIEVAFSNAKKAIVLIEIEVGEDRSGIIDMQDFIDLLNFLKTCKNIQLKGLFSHDGNSYMAKNLDECKQIHINAQKRTLEFAKTALDMGFSLSTISIGSTPSLMHDFPILEGITEIRPGTYVLMDASQASAYGSFKRCAMSVLSTVISRPTNERVILDVGAKGITMQSRDKGICAVAGMGVIKGFDDVHIFDVFDEHAIIYNKKFKDAVKVGDKVEIIPMHVCPVMNLHKYAFLVSKGEVVDKLKIAAKGKLT